MKSIKLIVIFTCLFPLLKAGAASFNCAKARSPVEKAICANSELSKLDENLAEVYKLVIKVHPVQNYIKARQKDWIGLNNYCEKDKIVGCLKKRYETRIAQLKKPSPLKIFSSSPNFDYSDGDAVAEIWQQDGKYQIYVWGGFRLHRQASSDAGKAVYTGCEFEGSFSNVNGGRAVGLINGEVKGEFDFKINGNKINYSDDTQICEGGFARLPKELTLISK